MTQKDFFRMGKVGYFFKWLLPLLALLVIGNLVYAFCSYNFPDEMKKRESTVERLLMHAITWTPEARSKLIDGYMQDGRFEEAAYWINYAVQQGDVVEGDAKIMMRLMALDALFSKRLDEDD